MVDAVVSYVVQKLGDYVLGEAAFLGGVRDDVAWLQRELSLLQGFIRDAEAKHGDNDLIRRWVSHIKDIAYDAEDVLDLFMLKAAEERKKGFLGSVKHKIREQFHLHNLGRKIRALKGRIVDLSHQSERYGLQRTPNRTDRRSNNSNTLRHLRRATSFAEEKDFIGFEDDMKKLMAQLLDNEPNCYTISILGTGGLGKTTIARKLYHHNEVRRRFHSFAWVCVSQDYKIRDLLLRLIKSFDVGEDSAEELERTHEEDLERRLFSYLRNRSYLVVVDDVWEEEAWQSLRRAFPDNKNRSRVIITTRKKKVADCWFERTHVHKLQFLSKEESWELFCKKAFWRSRRDEQLDTLGKEMVRKCRGLPLAVVVLAGLLSRKNAQEWHEVSKNIWRKLEAGSIEIKNLLVLSFDDLPCELKLFFLYLSHYPEDHELNVDRLIRQVVAEGLVSEHQGEMMEDVAKNNLYELINRSLIQIGKRCWGRIVTCRLHDLLRDLAIRKAEELNFINIYDEREGSTNSSMVSECRRHALYSINDGQLLLRKCNPRSRSLLSFTNTKILNHVCKKFTLLRVLNHSGFRQVEEIGRLTLLKHLQLRDGNLDKIPSSFGNLQKLQTLEFPITVPYGEEIKLTATIYKMKELRHLIGEFVGDLLLSDLTKLQTLKKIAYESWIKLDHEKFVNLRELHIIGGEEYKKINLESISKLKSLQILSIRIIDCFSASVQPFFCCLNLKELCIIGEMEALPYDMDALLPNLECVALCAYGLEEDPMPTLEKLPNLRFLQLGSNSRSKMVCTKSGFPRLEVLILKSPALKELQVEDGAMPLLQGLRISCHDELVIPQRLRSIPLPVEEDYFEDLRVDNRRARI